MFGQSEKCAFGQRPKEQQALKRTLIELLIKLPFEIERKSSYKLLIGLKLKLFLHFVWLVDKVADISLKLLGETVLLCQSAHGFEIVLFLEVLGADVCDDVAHAVDGIGEEDAAEGLDKG